MLLSEEQADYSFAEWWVLSQAHWLVMLYPSAYTITAAEVGFGTSGSAQPLQPSPALTRQAGAMLRFDYVHSTHWRSQYAPDCFGDAKPAKTEL